MNEILMSNSTPAIGTVSPTKKTTLGSGVAATIFTPSEPTGDTTIKAKCGRTEINSPKIYIFKVEIDPIEYVCVGASTNFIIKVIGTEYPLAFSLSAEGDGSIKFENTTLTTKGGKRNIGITKITGVSPSKKVDDVTIKVSYNGAVCATEPLTVASVKIKEINPEVIIEGNSTVITLEQIPKGFEVIPAIKIIDSNNKEVANFSGVMHAKWTAKKGCVLGDYAIKVYVKYLNTLTLVDAGTVTVNPKLEKTEITHNNKFLKTAWRFVTESISLSSKTFRPKKISWSEDDFHLDYLWGGMLSGETKSITEQFTTTIKAGRYDGTLQVTTRIEPKQNVSDTVRLAFGAVPAQARITAMDEPPEESGVRWYKTATIVYKLGSESRTFFREYYIKKGKLVYKDYVIFLAPEDTPRPSQTRIKNYANTGQLYIWTANTVNGQTGFLYHIRYHPDYPLADPARRQIYHGK